MLYKCVNCAFDVIESWALNGKIPCLVVMGIVPIGYFSENPNFPSTLRKYW